ncbi:MAG: flagellar hook-associated protein FlgK [Phycisphaeraceae bacterium]|nr:flagellar hook-associated protein FlgK [Phycisphaeraceae bacterium]
MTLTNAFNIGHSALTASQVAIQVAGHNLANISTPGYTRQVARLQPVSGSDQGSGVYIGRGVRVVEVIRQIDEALQGRLIDGISRESHASVSLDILSGVESLLNELTGVDLSSELNTFFAAFSEFANNPAATETRATVVEAGVTLASFMRALRSDLTRVQRGIDQQIGSAVTRADEILQEIASINRAVVTSESGRTQYNDLRDRRDQLLVELSQLIEVNTVEQPNGSVDVFVGSTPIVLAGESRGVYFDQETRDGELVVTVRVRADDEKLRITSGRIGGLLELRDGSVKQTADELDRLASGLIFEVNRLHSSGRASSPLRDILGAQRVPLADQTLAFNDPANATLAALPFGPVNGSFTVVVRDGSGVEVRSVIEVDLDGIDATGAQGFGDDTSLDDLRAMLNAIPNLNAEITPAGQLRVFTDAGFDVNFENDTSGILATLGMNTYFVGTDAGDIAVRSDLVAEPLLLVGGLSDGTNETALAIATLRERPVASLGGLTLEDAWLKTVERVGVETAGAKTRANATRLVRENLEAQRAGISGVSADEETLNLIQFQRQYQAAARFINIVDEMLQTLLSIV